MLRRPRPPVVHHPRSALTLVIVAVLAGVAGCGTPSPDLFVVNRSGTIPDARLSLLVSDGATVRCNGGAERKLGDHRLLVARKLAQDLDAAARAKTTLAPRPASILTFRVELENGTIRFSDTSRGITAPMLRMQAFTRDVAQHVCGLPR